MAEKQIEKNANNRKGFNIFVKVVYGLFLGFLLLIGIYFGIDFLKEKKYENDVKSLIKEIEKGNAISNIDTDTFIYYLFFSFKLSINFL